MATIDVKVPDIGGSAGIPVIELLVKPGDAVKKDQGLVTLESDKATMEVPSPAAGTIITLKVKLGDEVSEGHVIATVEVGLVIIAEASLSFLGLGTPAEQPSWGRIIAAGRDYLNTAWWISTLPGLALCLVVLCVGAFGDRLRDHLDPRLASRG